MGETLTPQAEARAQEIRRLQGACLRALGQRPDVELRGSAAWLAGRLLPMNAGHLYPALDGTDLATARGAADAMALRIRHSDLEKHLQHLPGSPGARFVFELLEQLRCESLATLPGVRANLQHGFDHWTARFEGSALSETELGHMLFALALVCRAKLTGTGLSPAVEDTIEAARLAFPAGVGVLSARLRGCRFDQEGFATVALELARLVDGDIAAHLASRGGRPAPRRRQDASGFNLQLDVAGDAAPMGRAALGESRVLDRDGGGYQAFTREFDRVLPAAKLVRAALLQRYRSQLDAHAERSGVNLRLIERGLRALLTRQDEDGWHGGAEQGMLDGSRLAALVASPADHRVFRTPTTTPRPFASVSFLVDCSGSMRHHALDVATFLDMAVRALERAGVPVEVLGFSTRAWNGGRAVAQWRRQGCPPAPGRLNELEHLVFKQAGARWRNSRASLAALLHQTLYKEGVDGEAVRWALGRLADIEAQQHVLIVLSDGSPSDTATALANDDSYLQQDLTRVIDKARQEGTSVAAIGVGLDMSPYFGEHATILDAAELPTNQGLRALLSLLRDLPALRR